MCGRRPSPYQSQTSRTLTGQAQSRRRSRRLPLRHRRRPDTSACQQRFTPHLPRTHRGSAAAHDAQQPRRDFGGSALLVVGAELAGFAVLIELRFRGRVIPARRQPAPAAASTGPHNPRGHCCVRFGAVALSREYVEQVLQPTERQELQAVFLAAVALYAGPSAMINDAARAHTASPAAPATVWNPCTGSSATTHNAQR